jgi:hypothetical protein
MRRHLTAPTLAAGLRAWGLGVLLTTCLGCTCGPPEVHGAAAVEGFPNTCPTVSCVSSNQRFAYGADGLVSGFEADLTVSAVDPDGDELRYVWRSFDCPGASFTPSGTNPTPELVDTGAASRTVHFTSQTTAACEVQVDVKDAWVGQAPGGLPQYRGCESRSSIGLSNASNAHFAPSLERLMAQSPPGPVVAGQTYQFGAEVADGNLEPGYPLHVEWYDDAATPAARGTFLARSPEAPYQLTAPGLVSIQWRAPTPLAPGMRLRLRVTNQFGLFTEHTFALSP